MGSASACSSLRRVLENHRDELIAEIEEQYRSTLIKEYGIELSDSCYDLQPFLVLIDGTEIDLKEISIDELAEQFPNCECGW